MFSYYVTDKEKRDKIIDFFSDKKVRFYMSEQYCLLKLFECNNDFKAEISCIRNYVFMFEWKDKKIKKEQLMAL